MDRDQMIAHLTLHGWVYVIRFFSSGFDERHGLSNEPNWVLTRGTHWTARNAFVWKEVQYWETFPQEELAALFDFIQENKL